MYDINAETVRDLVVASLDRDKAEDIEVIDLKDKTDFARFSIIATGRSNRHISALAEKLSDDLKASNIVPQGIHIEGMESKEWILVDAKEVIIHLFLPEVRERYDLSKLYEKWGC